MIPLSDSPSALQSRGCTYEWHSPHSPMPLVWQAQQIGEEASRHLDRAALPVTVTVARLLSHPRSNPAQ